MSTSTHSHTVLFPYVAEPSAAIAGQRLGQWELLRTIAQGPWSSVYRARAFGRSDDTAGSYAVKVARDDANVEALVCLEREARVGREVSHPHLVPILAAQLRTSPNYLVTPWLAGTTLRSQLAAGRRPTVPVALWIVRQLAEAVDALHGANWVHTDIKPDNILISPDGHATLLDLGFARREEEIGSAVDRPVVGTVAYMAPEMITSALRIDVRSDIYSLGVVLYELLTGRLPFEAGTLAGLARAHRESEPIEPRSIVPQIPSNVAWLVRTLLAKQPLRRPQTPQELVERLARLEVELFDDRWPLAQSA